ncbi:MAG: GatB/YqeY domain-containing protein [Sediminibacterium sp.]|nr:GatB/YqeY domain-containing protein [Sediminibacterium sp.]
MSLEQQVMEQMKEAMKSKNEAMLRGLRAIKAEIIKAKTEPGANGVLTSETELKMLQKMMKSRKDSLQIYQTQNRPDLAQKETEEIEIIEKFLPAQLSEAALVEALQQIITETGASGMPDLGKVMGIASKQLAGKADGKLIAEKVKQLLTNA